MYKVVLLAASAGAVALAAPASTQTITFSNLAAGNPPVTTYTENGYTFAVTAGAFNGTTGNGVPPPSVYTPTNAGTAQVTNGGRFTFLSVALGNGAFNGSATFTITGFLNNVQQFSFSRMVPASQFNTYQNTGNTGTIIDQLRFEVSGDGNIDNIVLMAATPEPATWSLMILGFGMVGFALRRWQAVGRPDPLTAVA